MKLSEPIATGRFDGLTFLMGAGDFVAFGRVSTWSTPAMQRFVSGTSSGAPAPLDVHSPEIHATTVGGSGASAISYERYLVDLQGRSFAQPTRYRRRSALNRLMTWAPQPSLVCRSMMSRPMLTPDAPVEEDELGRLQPREELLVANQSLCHSTTRRRVLRAHGYGHRSRYVR